MRKPAALHTAAPHTLARDHRRFSTLLTTAIEKAAHAQLSILGAMMIFSIIATLFRTLLTRLFPAWASAHGPWLAVVWALMEIGGGALAVIDTFPPLWLVCALCSFGGLSIWLQNLLFLDEKIRPAKLLLMRAVHGAACYALVKLLNPF